VQFENKVAIVTGAAQGIGEAYARALAAEGARVVVADLAVEPGRRVADAIVKAGGDASFVEVDVGSNESTTAMAGATVERYGGIDFLVNNAAIYAGMKIAPLIQVDWDYYTRFMDVNMNGALRCVRACYRSMRERGGGAIVNQSSTAAWMGMEATRSVVPKAALDHILAQMPLARQGRPEDLVGTLLFLLSDAASWLTGQIVNVDGGQIMRP
jgi:NAD(P)-dependent dehydrogenase (short-subunit alcohol dehydrogenase family)